ncbi:MAG: hypothetical protein KAJ55_02440, partial [Anaerolineales bacterium]|nr:hypothetical protein [Anaerolineales bacterium]
MTQVNLTNNEKHVLQALAGKDNISPDELAKASGLNTEAAMQSAFLLAEKGLSDVTETLKEIYLLTKEGEYYSNVGLPERQIINKIKGPAPISELTEQFPHIKVSIALGWLHRKNWARMEQNRCIPIGEANTESGIDENILKFLSRGSYTEDEIKQNLQRNDILKDVVKKKVNHKSPSKKDSLDLGSSVKDLIKRKLVEKTEEKTRTITITDAGKTLAASGLTIEEEISQLTPTIITSGAWKDAKIRPYNIHTPVKPVYGAKIHPYQRLINEMRRIFLDMGFTEIKGDIVQSSFWN